MKVMKVLPVIRVWLTFTLVCAIGLPTTLLAVQSTSHFNPAAAGRPSKPAGKLSPRLATVASSNYLYATGTQAQARAVGLPAAGAGSLLKDTRGRVLVYISMRDMSDASLATLRGNGAQIVHVSIPYQTVTAYIHPVNLSALSNLDAVRGIREGLAPAVQGSATRVLDRQFSSTATGCNTVLSEGDAQLGASTARSTYNVDGTGIKVGLLSDSFDQSTGAVTHAPDDVLAGELPGPGPCGTATGYITATTVVSPQVNNLAIGQSDEGRAMAQIVHDLAPGAQLGFASAFNGIYEFADNVRALRAWGADVIADDVYYYEEPFFQDGPVSVAISDVVGSGAAYFTSAGNSNADVYGLPVASYEAAAYRPTPVPNSCPAGLTWPGFDCHNFNPNPNGTPINADQVTLGPSGTIDIDLQWSEPWNGVVTDFDLYLLDMSGNVLESDITTNSGSQGTQQPFAYIFHQNLTGVSQTYRIVITRYGGTGTPRIKFLFSQNTGGLTSVQFNATVGDDTVGPTIAGHSASRYVSSVGATPYYNAKAVESFSSRGPAAHYLGPVVGATAASPIVTETLQQPDFTATDFVCTTFFFIYDGAYNCYRFQGTSAAAPHAAGVAALVLQSARRQGLTMTQDSMKSLLRSTAAPINGASVSAAGSGRLDALAAVRMTTLLNKAYLPVVHR